ncbi:MAG TPA: tetratricopeptide repeat protein [Brevundimonas sp.]|nr:tetratricopeptide repeat protein [Brevundimonas sp.]
MSYARILALAALIALPSSSFAQSPAATPPPPIPAWQQQATEAETARNFDRAIDLYSAAAVEAPNPIPMLIQVGRLQRLAGRHDAAQATYEDVLRRAPANPRAMLGMVAVEVARQNLEAAEGWLEQAVTSGLSLTALQSHPDLAPLRSRPAYAVQLERADQLANPCRHQPEFAAFDFWIGDWDIYVNGQFAGRNLITREMNGCIIHERADLVGGYRGESLNYYDPLDRIWKQTFVSNGANVVVYTGSSPRAGRMEMSGTSVAPGSTSAQLQRVVWELQADGTLTHVVSVSNDNGATWGPGFVGLYRPTDRQTPTRDPDATYPYNDALSRPASPAQ